MVLLSGLMAGAAYLGESAFKFNRENYLFDGEIQLEREYQGMEMRIKKFELYREDVRDLVDLTVVKMDKYLIVNTLQVGFCVTLLTEGRPEVEDPDEPSQFPPWILFTWQMCIVGAMLYYVLSMWLAMHASIAAHSFGVRLLTQFIRLPLPNAAELDNARKLAKGYEASQIRDMLRIPVWKQQMKRLNDAMADLNTDEDEIDDAASAQEDASGARSPVPGQGNSPVAMMRHVRLYRQLQANWQSYDAYARVCMALGTFQFLQAMAYFSLASLISAHDVVWPAFACIAVYLACAVILMRLDLMIGPLVLIASATMLFAPCLLGFVSAWFDHVDCSSRAFKEIWRPLMLICYVLHIVWIAFTLFMARAKPTDLVCLPTKFNAVLYLDVFGWMQTDREQRNRLGSDDGGAGAVVQFTWTEDDSAPQPRAPVRSVPSGVQEQLIRTCLNLRSEISEDLERWESQQTQEELEESPVYLNEIRLHRQNFDNAGQQLDALEHGNPLNSASATASVADEAPAAATRLTVWLKMEFNPNGSPIDYFFNCDDGSTVWEAPENTFQDPARISELRLLDEKVAEYGVHCRSLAVATVAGPAAAAPAAHPAACSSFGPRSTGEVQPDEVVPVAGGVFGGREAAEVEETPDGTFHSDAFGGAGAMAGASFQPGGTFMDGAARPAMRRGAMPGSLPWRTVLIGSLVLMFLWLIGTAWIVIVGVLEIDIPFDLWGPRAQAHLKELRLGKPELIFSGPWPHAFFRPEALACHPASGKEFRPTILIAERYAIHEFRLSKEGTHNRTIWQLRPTLEDCLASNPALQGRGLAGLSYDCPEGGRGDCSVVLLGADGQNAVRCALRFPPSAQRLALHGGHWRALISTGANSSIWTLGNDGLTHFSPRYNHTGAIHNAFPTMDFQHRAAANFSALAVLENRFLFGLEPSGLIHAWPQQGGSYRILRLPGKEARWHSLCASSAGIFLTGTRHRDQSQGIYRLDLPEALSEILTL